LIAKQINIILKQSFVPNIRFFVGAGTGLPLLVDSKSNMTVNTQKDNYGIDMNVIFAIITV